MSYKCTIDLSEAEVHVPLCAGAIMPPDLIPMLHSKRLHLTNVKTQTTFAPRVKAPVDI